MLVGMAFSALFFLLQYLLTKGKGLGEGDIWLGLLLGAIFSSYLSLISAIFSAYIIGSLVGVLLILFKNKSWGSKLPLGVFLAIGTLIALIFEKNIAVLVAWYF
jgi:prepilin signal peptidase PulO-like enzyme (type II secretory pathway)